MSVCACTTTWEAFSIFLHGSGEADAAAVLPDAVGPGEAQDTRRAVDGFQGGTDEELAGRPTAGVGAAAGDMGQDFCPPVVHVFQGDHIDWWEDVDSASAENNQPS